MTGLKDLKASVMDIDDALREINCDSQSALPTRDAIRSAMCRLRFAKERIVAYVYDKAE